MIEEVLKKAYALVTPTVEEENKLSSVASSVKEFLKQWISSQGLPAEVEVLGSAARSTWLPNQRDVDMFIILKDRDIKPEEIIQKAARHFSDVGIPWAMRYAQHPYLTLFLEGYEVDVVPCYEIRPGERPITAADRSPLHHRFLAERLTESQKRDVRLLKLFLRTIGVYGAEIRVEGFSGYLTELLAVYYGSFLDVLKAVERWRPYKTYIAFSDVKKKFKAPLVVIDPVDPERNVAAAVSLTSVSTFILAARRFLRRPSLSYFSPQPAKTLRLNTVEVVFPYPQMPPEVVWGKYKKLGKTLYNWVKECGFKVYRWGVESDEKTYVMLIYVVEQVELQPFVLHRGPPVYDKAVDAFVEKYLGEEVVGPFVQGSKVYVIKRRKFVNLYDCITSRLGEGEYTIYVNTYGGKLVEKNPWLT
ncbi:MAG: CCA tRNA nucleotidyltransferase [Pyrobaculum sp.]